MKGRLSALWENIRTSFWFIPGLMAAASIALSFVMIQIDQALIARAASEAPIDAPSPFWMIQAGAAGVRAVLQTIAGSMITIAGTVFSITIIALTLASQQFGPRLLRNFMRDRGNQMVLGTFTATFLYSILVLRTVSDAEEARFVPQASAVVAVVLAVASVGVLIFFIHHAAISIQAPYIVARVSKELETQIERLFPETLGHPPPEPFSEEESVLLPESFEAESIWLSLEQSGYIENINESELLDTATEHDLVISLRCRPGAFIVPGEACMQVWPGANADEQTLATLRSTVTLGRARTAEQDVSFAVDQLVEVAAKSLSPSINDPFTALACIDRLGEAFARLATREIPSAARLDDQGHLRVIAPPFRLVHLVRQSLEPIRQYAAAQSMILLRMLDTIAIVGRATRREEDRQVLLDEIDRIAATGEKHHGDDPQGDRIAARAEIARKAIHKGEAPARKASGNPMHE